MVHQKEKFRSEHKKTANGKRHEHFGKPQESASSDSLNETVLRKEMADYDEVGNKTSGKRKPKWSKTLEGKHDNR